MFLGTLLFLLGIVGFFLSSAQAIVTPVTVTPVAETAPVVGVLDSADDTAIWIHPTDTSLSLIIGTDKKGYADSTNTSLITGGTEVYDLSGNKLQVIAYPTGNVDLRYNFPLGGQNVDIAVATNQSTRELKIWKVNPATLSLEDVTARSIITSGLGVGMYYSLVSGKYYVFLSKTGKVQQWELFDNGAGLVDATLVRTVTLKQNGSSEGIAIDDVTGIVYASEEPTGVYKFPAEPSDTSAPVLMDSVSTLGGNLTADVEGITIYYKPDGTGYIIVSSQNADAFDVYHREGNNQYIGRFKIGSSATVDNVTHTDGIEVTNFPLGVLYPTGLFIAQDDNNPNANKNHKLVDWNDLAQALGLTSDTSWNPRLVGAGPLPTPTPTLTPDPNATPTPTLTPTPSPTPTPVPQLLLNPSFEADTDNNNKPDVWTQSSVFVKSAELVQSGTFSGKFLNTSSKTIAQVVKNLTPGVYNYSAWVNIPQTSQTGFYATLRIVWRNSSGNNISTSVVKTYTGVTSGWDNATATLTAPAGTNRASVQILVKKLNGSVYVDNLSLTR